MVGPKGCGELILMGGDGLIDADTLVTMVLAGLGNHIYSHLGGLVVPDCADYTFTELIVIDGSVSLGFKTYVLDSLPDTEN